MSKRTFTIVKKETSGTVSFEKGANDTYNLAPKNKIRLKGTIRVTKMHITDQQLAKAIIQKKLDHKINELVYLIAEGQDDTGDTIRQALNDVTYYKSILLERYAKYLKQKEIDDVLRKLNLIENELKLREVIYMEHEKEAELGGKSR